MALPIEPTPILEGKDAKRLIKDMKIREKGGMSKADKKFLSECEELYKLTKNEL